MRAWTLILLIGSLLMGCSSMDTTSHKLAPLVDDAPRDPANELVAFLEQNVRARDSEHRDLYRFDRASGRALADFKLRVRNATRQYFRTTDHEVGINQLTEEVLETNDNYTLTRVRFKNALNLANEMIIATPTGSGPHPLLVIPNGSVGKPENIMGLTTEDYHHNLGRVFADAGFGVAAVNIPSPKPFTEAIKITNAQFYLANIIGENFSKYFIVDKMLSAMDYLETLSWVDRNRVATYGISLGGWASILSSVLDSRITATIVSGTNVLTPIIEQQLVNRRFQYAHYFEWRITELPTFIEMMASLHPQPLAVEIGRQDQTGIYSVARKQAERLQALWQTTPGAPFLLADVNVWKHEVEIQEVKAWLIDVWQVKPPG